MKIKKKLNYLSLDMDNLIDSAIGMRLILIILRHHGADTV